MESAEIRKRFLSFFEARGYATLPSASLIPEGDASTLFVTAGMQPLVPYLLGQPHPKGGKLVNVQRCFRTSDIDEVGDSTHLTFFEMLGRWELDGFVKRDVLASTFEFLTARETGLGLDPKRMYVSLFSGDANAPRDDESAAVWRLLGVPVYFRAAGDNWWSVGESGPCGPDSEVFYDVTQSGLGELSPEAFQKGDDTQQLIEIWNDVFMEYEKREGTVVGRLAQPNLDTGVGFERLTAVVQKKDNVFETDLFSPIIDKIRSLVPEIDTRSERIITDHIRATVFLITDSVLPSNTDRGYVLRRLIRRITTKAFLIDQHFDSRKFNLLTQLVMNLYSLYVDKSQQPDIEKEIGFEIRKFRATIEKGLRELEKGISPFVLATTYGFPIELTLEIAKERGIEIDLKGFEEKMRKHRKISRAGNEQKFKGGLADAASSEVVKLHTATHLLNAALKKVLGPHVRQRGSNITAERLRFDFSHPEKLTGEQKRAVAAQVNEWISRGLPVVREEMPREEAERLGAAMEFGAKYPDMVSVYTIRDGNKVISREFCGGPHVTNTRAIGRVTLTKEESVAAGTRRLRAVLQ